MDSSNHRLRAILPLLKGTIVAKDAVSFKIAIGGSTTITVTPPNMAIYDIRDGDLLTLYTEVLYAKPVQSSIQ